MTRIWECVDGFTKSRLQVLNGVGHSIFLFSAEAFQRADSRLSSGMSRVSIIVPFFWLNYYQLGVCVVYLFEID